MAGVNMSELSDAETKLKHQLADPFFINLKQRVESGDLVFTFGSETWWRVGSWNDPYGKVSIPFALRMALACPQVKEFKVYYHIDTDFQHIRFEADGETYIVRWYKTYILCRMSDRKQIDFGRREWDITEAFSRGLHKVKESPYWRDSSGGPDHFLVLGPPDELGDRYIM
jgi:hypothetical protein